MSYLEELLPEFRKGAKIRRKGWLNQNQYYHLGDNFRLEMSKENIQSNDWEFYQEPEPDWQYIIENKCLCWFWDNQKDDGVCGVLTDKTHDKFDSFIWFGRTRWNNCRPLRRDEITFYEDKKDVEED